MKKYITYTNKFSDNWQIIHPNTWNKINKLWLWNITIQETNYWNIETDKRLIWIIEYNENLIQDVIDRFINQYQDHAVFIIDEIKANELLIKWYWLDVNWKQNISVENFIFTNNIQQ